VGLGGRRARIQALHCVEARLCSAYHWYSHVLISQGRFDESLAQSLHALALDPLDVAMNFHLGFHYWNARQYDQARAQLEKTLTMDPYHHETHGILGLVYSQQRRYREAIAEEQKSMELGGWDKRGFLGYLYAVSGHRGEAQKVLGQLLDEARSKPVSAYNIAKIYTGLGEKEQAFSWLERAIDERDSNLTMPGLNLTCSWIRCAPIRDLRNCFDACDSPSESQNPRPLQLVNCSNPFLTFISIALVHVVPQLSRIFTN
jgi:tetratricopeptide (TPR) repeat protein